MQVNYGINRDFYYTVLIMEAVHYMKIVKHRDWLRGQLKDPGFAAEYLTAAVEDEEPAVFLQALREIAEAQGILPAVGGAEAPGESSWRVPSTKDNPS